MLALKVLTYIEGNDQTGRPIWNYATRTVAFSNSTAGKYVPMQVIKQPEHGRTSTTDEQK